MIRPSHVIKGNNFKPLFFHDIADQIHIRNFILWTKDTLTISLRALMTRRNVTAIRTHRSILSQTQNLIKQN